MDGSSHLLLVTVTSHVHQQQYYHNSRPKAQENAGDDPLQIVRNKYADDNAFDSVFHVHVTDSTSCVLLFISRSSVAVTQKQD